MRKALQLCAGFLISAGLLIATVWLWVHNLIIFAAPLGFAAAGAAWVTVDNTLIYPKQRTRSAGMETDGAGDAEATDDAVAGVGAPRDDVAHISAPH